MDIETPEISTVPEAIAFLEAHLAKVRAGMPSYNGDPIQFYAENKALLLDFISEVNNELGIAELEEVELVCFSADGFQQTLAWLKQVVPFAMLWRAIQVYCRARRCSIQIKVGKKNIKIEAANPEDAERLMKLASRMRIVREDD